MYYVHYPSFYQFTPAMDNKKCNVIIICMFNEDVKGILDTQDAQRLFERNKYFIEL